MAFRGNQEEKFKNIVLKVQPVRGHSPDLHTSNPLKPTSSPTNSNSPKLSSPPVNMYKFFGKEMAAVTPQAQNRPFLESSSQETVNGSKSRALTQSQKNHSSAIIFTNQIQENEQDLIYRLQSEIREKEEIIMELKSIILISNENSTRGKVKSSSFGVGDRSPSRKMEEMEKEMKQLKHNVKILTIENNSLSDYIDRLKTTLGSKTIEHFDIQQKQKEAMSNLSRIQSMEGHYKAEMGKLKKVIQQQQLQYQRKIDEFIASHKSLAHECKIIQQEKSKIELQNAKLAEMVKDLQQSSRKLHCSDQKMKNSTLEKFSIQKIKEQYAESLKQVKDTVAFETQHIFDQFRSRFQLVATKAQLMDQQIVKIQEFLRNFREKSIRQSPTTKKSDIYIEEGIDSSQNSSSSRRKFKDYSSGREKGFIMSRVYEEGSDSRVITEEATRPLRDEIIRLKDIVNELENQISQRSDYYTFRQKEYEDYSAQISSQRLKVTLREEQMNKLKKDKEKRQKQLFDEIQRHKIEINKLEMSHKRQKNTIHESFVVNLQKKDSIISELRSQMQTLKLHYDTSTSQLNRFASSARLQSQLQKDNERLKDELQECISKIQQYKKLFTILKQESQENVYYQQLLTDMKSQICLIREKYHNDLSRLSQVQKEKEDLVLFNQEIKGKLEQTMQKSNQISFEEQKYKETIRSLQNQRAELNNQVTYLKSTIWNLEKDLKAKTETEIGLIDEKKKLEKQVVGYLSLVRKISMDEPKELSKSRCIHEQFGLEELLAKVNKLESSISQQRTSKRQKREKIVQALSETLAETEFLENRRLL